MEKCEDVLEPRCMSDKVADARETERFGVEETTSRGPSGLYVFEGDCTGREVARSGLIELQIEGGFCDDGSEEVGVRSSSTSNGEVSGMSRDSRAYSSLKMSGLETRLEDLELDEDDCHEARGDILRSSGGNRGGWWRLCKSPPEPSIQRFISNDRKRRSSIDNYSIITHQKQRSL